MAFFRGQGLGQAFRNNRQLQQFILSDVTPTGRTLGTGSFGSVEEVMYKRLICAGKRIHEILLDVENEGVPEMIQKYLNECQLMSNLHHPNITQFLGLCFLPGSQLPLLVMERLETSLDDLLENAPNLPLLIKRSVLENVACGLLYLHERNPPVIHRDLTSKNVLLTSSLIAKITDMGNSRIVRPGQMVRTLSALPGTQVYMPPEAQDDRHCYGPSIDIFSFGHLSLFTITQRFPGTLLSSTFVEAGNLHARSEVQRREQYIETLEAHIGRYHPALVELVKECLNNDPDRRPTTDDLLVRLQRMREEVEGQYGAIQVKLDLSKMRLARELRQKDRRLEELTQLQTTHEAELVVKDREIASKDQEIVQQRGTVRRLQNEIQELQLRETQLRDELQSQEAEIGRLRDDLRECQGLLQAGTKVPFKLPLQFKWRRGPDMPFAMGGTVHSVRTQSTVYVGKRAAVGDDHDYLVMSYDISAGKWIVLPPYSTRYFTMTVIDNHLVLVGGRGHNGDSSKTLGMWSEESRTWTHPYPEMTTPRQVCTVVLYMQYLVVAGGYGRDATLSSVEVMNTDTKQWCAGPPTPRAWSSMKTALAGDVCYFMGGYIKGIGHTVKVYGLSLPALISRLNSDAKDLDTWTWKELPQLSVTCAAPLSISGALLAVGGWDNHDKAVSAALRLYLPDTEQWVKVAEMPTPRCSCACIMTTDKELLVAAGWGDKDYKGQLITLDLAQIS